jgi:hypothetical protein
MTEKEINYTELDELIAIKESKGKILSVDFGDVRTGLAVSDASRLLASGIGYISVGGIEKTAEAIAESAKENAEAQIRDAKDNVALDKAKARLQRALNRIKIASK